MQINAGLHAHFTKYPGEVLSANISGGIWSKGTTTYATKTGIEYSDARFNCC
jgi:hypothetical protein